MTEIDIRKGDSLGTIRNGAYNDPRTIPAQDMNTAVILNQSSFNGLFQSNEWKGHHPAIYPTSYHLPAQNLLPIASLKQLSLGKTTDNKWVNRHGVYSSQIPMASVFSPPLVTLKQHLSIAAPNLNHLNAQSLASTHVPQFSRTSTQIHTKSTGVQGYHVPLTPISATELYQRTGQNMASINVPQFSTTATQSHAKSTGGYCQSVTENVSDYLIQNLGRHQNGTTNLKSPTISTVKCHTPGDQGYRQPVAGNVGGNLGFSIQILGAQQNNTIKSSFNSAVKLNEHSSHKDAHINNSEITSMYEKQRELSLTRKRSSSWPSGSGLSKKKFIHGQTQDDQVLEEYKNLEMDVANILISDIPIPVISLGLSETEKSSVRSGGGQERNKQAKISPVGSGEATELEERSYRSNVWSGRITECNKQPIMLFPVGSGEVMEPEKQLYTSIARSGEVSERNRPANMLPIGSGEMKVSNQQADMSRMKSGLGEMTEPEQQGKRLNTWIEGMLVPGKQANTSLVWCGGVPEPSKQAHVGSGVELDPEKLSSDGGIDSDTSAQFENEKENYSKNLVDPNKVVFTCQQCVVTFESTQDLISHTASHTNNNFSFKCNVCTQVFRSTSGLQKHVEFHADHRNNFQCSFCFKSFPDRDNLEEHIIASHMSKRPHKCSYCPKAFRDPGSLQKHIRIHTGERPYKCTACEKSFAEYSSLRKHYRVHTGEQPYRCQYCPKAFSISGNLQRHILIHTGERPYKCSECNKTFNNPSHLRRHEKNLHSKLEGEK